METHGSPQHPGERPDPREARDALREIERASVSASEIRTPLWYFLALGTLVAPVGPAVALLPDPPLRHVIGAVGLVVWMVALATLVARVTRHMGVVKWLTPRQMLPPVVGLAALTLIFAALNLVLGQGWILDTFSVAVGALIAVFGVYHSRTAGKEPA
ncbi:hypothetical protein [Halostreptopolyspora alba]|uniref:Uncharacterized protein n=1 Tax=Halostreptopolyspora alba TaxID=2487137 RepID=A0A3N0EHQ4_9ACTN|nr:hypothetical protein EFW17_00580 [Nocardiopsaceae bacterium YIM 96095]